MVESFPVSLAVGTVLGFLSGLGVGGGSLLILWLTLVLGMEQSTARVVNLLFFIPAAVVSCCFRWKQGALPIRAVFPGMAAGCLSAAVFTWLAAGVDGPWLKKLFGILLLATGIREVLWKEK